ncbi:phosphate:H+ symporter [Emericellopsis cladophorae]|uniref:Phosphate:H+ symporter n=1 Tax=Emericellopsis cladophorae TaxID=2686198 RepID=A0A9Q0BBK2_9HYPO|nr:phosphate:H+ symporter [Emericellopsis cladophorae]KAI6779882.1 phosphate:H+ symporter [Emericellopsis cladophorae]
MEESRPPPRRDMDPATQDRTVGGNTAFHNFYNDYSHIPDPNLRRRLALSDIDKVPFGWYHVRAILVAGVGFFLDSYDIFAINLITSLLGLVFWGGGDPDNGYGGNQGHLPGPINQALKASTSSGIIIGMILFGWLADAFGRRRMYGYELAIIIFATFSCALVASSPGIGSAGLMIFWRVVMGIGIGGDYPLSSVITAEFAPTRWRGAMVGAVFSMQGLGQLAAAVVALVMTAAYKDAYVNVPSESACDAQCRLAADRSWRIIVGVGALPACLALYYRLTIPETPRYTFDVQLDVDKADRDIQTYMASKHPKDEVSALPTHTRQHIIAGPTLDAPQASWRDFATYFSEGKNFRVLAGTSMSWFFLDLAYYGLGLNNSIVLHAIGYGAGANMYDKLHNQAVGLIILACAGSIPGYWAAVFTIDTFGRKPLQIGGFLLLTILFSIIGFRLHSLSEKTLLGLYVVAQFLFNAGPNTTTFIVSGECFPTRYRALAHGISAAMGKLGAVVAQVMTIPILNHGKKDGCTGNECSPHLDRLLQLFALFMLLGTLVSLLIPETKGLTLEELAGESRTSYNAGCNGSINLAPSRGGWNPFSGGQPAGFAYPKAHAAGFAKGTRSRGTTNTTCGTLDSIRRRRAPFWRSRKRARTSSNDTSDIVLDAGVSAAAESPLPPATPMRGSGVSSPPHQQMPMWGAGWGRIDRGTPTVEMDEVRLHDVGSLLPSPRESLT